MKKLPVINVPRTLFLKATKFGLIQSKFHRISKYQMTEALKPFNLSTVEWIILGFLNHIGKYVQFSDVADEIGVKDSFITVIAAKLEGQKYITISQNEIDKRKKSMRIAKEGKKILSLTERQFIHFFTPLVNGLNEKDLAHFLKIMQTFIKNYDSHYKR